MAILLTDSAIEALISERKPLPRNFPAVMSLKPKRGHKEREFELECGDYKFLIILRQSDFNVLDFSAILAVLLPGATAPFRLRRYNGKHEHTNKLEREKFFDFHVHMATERYQDSGLREDVFAIRSDQHYDLQSALDRMLKECGFSVQDEPQLNLF